MKELLTQTHLGVMFLDRDTRTPIARMPVYAEASIVIVDEPPMVPVDLPGRVDDYLLQQTLGPVLRQALANGLEDGGFESLSPEQRSALVQSIREILNEKYPNVLQLPPEAMRAAAADAVSGALERFAIRPRVKPLERSIWSFPLGFLATDHIGYVSFDLARLQQAPRLSVRQDMDKSSVALNVYPMGTEGERLEALTQARTTAEAVFAKFEIARPEFDPDIRVLNLPSMQNPSIVDWYLSPGSFTTQPDFLVGSEECEALVPSQLSMQTFIVSQVVRLRDIPKGITLPGNARSGYLDSYRISWHALGHSLGQIQYSLPLAPGESVKLSLVDWSWDSSTSRTEDTKVTESLLHDTHRDRVINETMRASLQELQHGSSTMGGAALSAGGAASGGSYGGAVGASGAIGSTYSTSSGSRDLAAQNVQNLSDTFAQKSSSLRELTSTVVVQAHEAQREAIETRTFTNYNHSHTLTILYYEILRHFRVDTEWVGRRPVVLLPGASVSFDPDAILESTICTQRPLLQAALLDPSLAPAFDALEKLQISRENYKLHGIIAGNVAKPTAASDFLFTLFELLIKTSDGLRDKSSAKVVGFVRKFDGRAVPLNFLYEGPHSHEEYQGNDNGPQNLNSGAIFDDTSWAGIYVQPENPVRWGDIAGFEFEKWGNDEWRIDRIGITAFNKDLQIPLVPFDTDTDMYFRDDEPSAFSLTFIKRPDPDPPTPGPVPTPEQALTSEETRLVTRLKEHLKAEIEHYARILRLGRNPNKIAVEFEKQPWDAGTSVLDHVEPYPLEVFGDFVAYPLIDAVDPAGAPDAPPAQELISFPVRGVFAEGKLGHCNLSEEIDETRFWRWEEHTIPIQAPDIAAATPVTPTPLPVNVSPTPLPAGLVNIVNPSPAPDPTGLAAALTAITTANAFRDMSGQTQLTDLLKKLSDNSVAIAQVARSTLASGGGTAGGGTGAAGTGGGAPSSSGGKSPAGSSTAAGGSTGGSGVTRAANPAPQSVAEVNDLAAGIRRQLPPDQANGLVGDLYQNVVDRTAADAGADAAATTPRVTISAATDSQIVQAGNVVFFNAIDVDNYFRDVTGQTFSAWFAGTLANRGSWAGLSMATDAATLARFVQTWDAFPPIVGSDHGDGTPGTTLVEFAALMAVFIHETGGNLLFRGAERIGGPGHSGLSYPFDTFVIHRPGEDPFTKGSYNTGNGNHTAYTNFHDPKYLAAFGALQPTTQSVRDLEAWKGVVWPASVPTAPDAGTAFLQESDFYKFRGRGAIQSTGRVAYLPIVTFVRAYTGNDVMITAVRNRWATFATALGAQGVNVTTDDDFATVSTNADWDSLFTSVTIQAAAISGHNGLAGKHYLPLSSTPATLKGTARGSVFYLAKGIAGKNDDYATHVRNRVVDFIGTLWAVLTPTPPAGAGGADGGVINL